jgi:hypothetical protein
MEDAIARWRQETDLFAKSCQGTVSNKILGCDVESSTNCNNFEMVRPEHSWDASGIPMWLVEAVNSMGFNRMTPVQKALIPLLLGNKDVVVSSELLHLSKVYTTGQTTATMPGKSGGVIKLPHQTFIHPKAPQGPRSA